MSKLHKIIAKHLATPKLNYIGQCDKLRRSGCEEAWQEMVKSRSQVSLEEFSSKVDWSSFTDEESVEEFGLGDPDLSYYKSTWYGLPCYFIQHAGFEFIFA